MKARYPIALAIGAFTLLRIILAFTAPLTPQEAYYWTWSRFPDWSYFDHPPLASYAIALTTSVLGQTVPGIKMAAVLWALGWNLLWAGLVRDMFDDRRLAFWSLLALNLSLLYELYGFGPTPDGPLLFGWIGTIWAVWRVQRSGDGRWWFAAGACMGLAWLGKYSGVLLLPIVGLYLLAVPSMRVWLRRPQPWLAVLLAVLVFSPVLAWNAGHGWVSLAFQSSHRVAGMGGFKPRFFLVLVVTQFLLLSPYVFGLSLFALARGVRQWLRNSITPAELLLLLNALVPLLLFTAVSFRSNAKINWLIPAWWSLVVLGMHHVLQADLRPRLRAWGLGVSGVLLAAGVVVSVVPNLPVPGNLNIWSGWQQAAQRLERRVQDERAAGGNAFVFSPNYKISSLLWFYRPGQERTYAQDILGRKALQYDYFPHDRDLAGATGFLVVSDQAQSRIDMDKVRPLFDSLERVETVDVGLDGKRARHIEIWRGTGYRGRPDGEDGEEAEE